MVFGSDYAVDEIFRYLIIGNVLTVSILKKDTDLAFAVGVKNRTFYRQNLFDILFRNLLSRRKDDKPVIGADSGDYSQKHQSHQENAYLLKNPVYHFLSLV